MIPKTFPQDKKNIVRSYLRAHAYGRQRAIGKRALSSELGILPDKLRDIIRELIFEGELIGSSSDAETGGYWIIETWAEFDEATRELKSRIARQSERLRQLDQNAIETLGNQDSLFREAV